MQELLTALPVPPSLAPRTSHAARSQPSASPLPSFPASFSPVLGQVERTGLLIIISKPLMFRKKRSGCPCPQQLGVQLGFGVTARDFFQRCFVLGCHFLVKILLCKVFV